MWAWSEESRGTAGRGESGVVDSDGVCVKVWGGLVLGTNMTRDKENDLASFSIDLLGLDGEDVTRWSCLN